MTTRALASLTTVAALAFTVPAHAQTASGPMTSDEAVAQAGPTAPPAGSEATQLIQYHGTSYSVGWRIWAMYVPQPIVNLFVRQFAGENGQTASNSWGGGLNVATGPEFVYRKDNLDIALSVMYVGYYAQPGFFHGTTEGPDATERITSNLFGLYVTSHFLWGIRLHRMFELQIGIGVGVGYIGGELLRSQAYSTPDPAHPGQQIWLDCQEPGRGAECGNDNNHYSHGGGANQYVEPSWAGGGSRPLVIPWISVPQIGLHFRPHRNVDMRLDFGYALIGIYGGFAAHYIF